MVEAIVEEGVIIMQDLIGIILPGFIDLINRNVKNSTLRYWIAFGVSVVVAVALNLDKLQSGSWEELAGKIGLVFTEAQIVYKGVWEDLGVRKAAGLDATERK